MVVATTSATIVTCKGMSFRGDSSGTFYKQRLSYVSGSNRILLNNPNFSLSNLGSGDEGGSGVARHDIQVDTTIASADPEVFQVLFSNSLYSRSITTIGTEIEISKLLFLDDVQAYVTRTGLAEDVVTIDWSRNGGASEHTEIITAGNSVAVSYTYLTTLSTDDFKVTIVEG